MRVPFLRPSLMLLAVLIWAVTGPAVAAPELKSDTPVATAGFYQLQWEADQVLVDYELQEATRADFADARSLYRGPDRASVLSGKSDGDYYYRVRVLDATGASPWSDSLHVQVRSHPLNRALVFLALGALVFLATVVLILRGEARTR